MPAEFQPNTLERHEEEQYSSVLLLYQGNQKSAAVLVVDVCTGTIVSYLLLLYCA